MDVKKKIKATGKTIKRKITVSRKKVVKFVKDKKHRKQIVLVVAFAIILFIWYKYGKKGTTTTPPASNGGNTTGSDRGGALVGSFPNVSGNVTPKVYYVGFLKHLNIDISGSDGNWIIKDLGTEPLQSGHQWQYQIKGDVFRQSNRVDGYQVKGNDPIRIILCMPKTGAPELSHWGDEGWQDPELCGTMSENVSFAVFYVYFN
jgi:hypothetical protein